MKEDLKFLQDRFEDDGLTLPESLSEDRVRTMLEAAGSETTESVAPTPRIVDSSIDDASMDAPDTVEAAATDALSTGPSQAPPKKSRPRWRRPLLAAAACALVAIALVPILHQVLPGEDPANRTAAALPADENGLYQFTSYADLDAQISSLLPEEPAGGGLSRMFKSANSDVALEESIDMAAGDSDAASADMGSGSGGSAMTNSPRADSTAKGSGHSKTYTQVEGIDEADIVKTDGKYIYYVSSMENQIIIAKASKGKARRVAAVGGNSEGSYINDIYINGDQLVVIGDKGDDGDAASSFRKGTWTSNTVVTVYDIRDRAKPQRTREYTQSGHLLSSRLIGDRLLLVTRDGITSYVKNRSLPFVSYDGDSAERLPIEDIACFPQVSDPAYTVVGLMDLAVGKTSRDTVKTKAILGGAEEIYCSGETLYVTGTINGAAKAIGASGTADGETASGDVPTITNDGDTYAWSDAWHWQTQILKVSLADGKVKYQRSAIVDGTVNNQWSMDERDGTFRVATTADHNGSDVNDLFLLDENMKQVGSVIGFAKDEHIEAVRYIGQKAYVITYEQTDPLFVIDLSDATSPFIEGHVKISGFSTLLVPADASHLLGLGYGTETTEFGEATDGLKLALFDISDPASPQAADQLAFPDAYSPVQYDHKALLAGPGGDYYAVPYDYENWEDTAEYDEDGAPAVIEDAEEPEDDAGDSNSIGDAGDSDAEDAENAGTHTHGILVFSARSGSLQILNDLECAETVNRCIYIGDYLYGICSDDRIEGFQVQ